jgi:hypothetical protein
MGWRIQAKERTGKGSTGPFRETRARGTPASTRRWRKGERHHRYLKPCRVARSLYVPGKTGCSYLYSQSSGISIPDPDFFGRNPALEPASPLACVCRPPDAAGLIPQPGNRGPPGPHDHTTDAGPTDTRIGARGEVPCHRGPSRPRAVRRVSTENMAVSPSGVLTGCPSSGPKAAP